MEVCKLANRAQQGEAGNLQASSLETLLQLVSAGFGCTLVPALAAKGSWMVGGSVSVRKLDLPDTYRQISLVFRRSFPRRQALEAFGDVIRNEVPSTVRVIKPS
jgi:LysR family hydrogen peroxide-inducible transcriptional activator